MPDKMSGLIWVQAVSKGYQQTPDLSPLERKELNPIAILGCLVMSYMITIHLSESPLVSNFCVQSVTINNISIIVSSKVPNFTSL